MHVQSVQKQFFIVKYANLWGFCFRRRRGCLNFKFLLFHEVVDHRTRTAAKCTQRKKARATRANHFFLNC